MGAIVIPTDFSIMGISVAEYRWALIKNATIAEGGWLSSASNSSVEYKHNVGVITDGIIIRSGYFSTTANNRPNVSLSTTNPFRYQLERNTFTNKAYTFTIAVLCKVNNAEALGSIDWEEIT